MGTNHSINSRNKIIIKIFINVGLTFFLNFSILSAQMITKENQIPLDPSIRHGQLANGFTYFIKNLEIPSKKINMHLYVKTGVIYQKQYQLDFAHALEHLAFTCAPSFPKNLFNNSELLVRLKMENGDISGHTRTMYTAYNLKIPNHNINAMDYGLLWFRDISNLRLTNDRIEKERGVLRQEASSKQGSKIQRWFKESLMESQLFSFKLDNSNFFEHNKTFPSDSLKTFYKRWYKPNRMGLVIVGSIKNINTLERMIKSKFSNLSGFSETWTDTRICHLEKPNQFVTVELDKDNINSNRVEFYLYLRDNKILKERRPWKFLQRRLIWTMLSKLSLLNNRFKETSMTYNTSFSAFGHADIQALPMYRIKVTSNSDQGKEAFQTTIRILNQIRKLGFTQTEWELAKKEQLIDLKSVDTTKSKYWLGQIKEYYVHNSPLPKNKTKGLEQWLSELSLKDFNKLVGDYFSDIVNDIGIIVPHGRSSMYSEKKVRRWMEEVLQEIPQPYPVPEVPKYLLSPSKVSTLKEVDYKELDMSLSSPLLSNNYNLKNIKPQGVKELVLNNGIKVVLDTSSSKNNMIQIHGFSPKGANCFPEEDYFSSINATSIIKHAGVSSFNKFELGRFLSQTSFQQGVFPYINDQETGIRGKADLKDFEKLLQLIYLYFTEPRLDKIAFDDWELMEKRNYLNAPGNNITNDFEASMAKFIGDQTKISMGIKGFQGISKTKLNRSYEIYKQLFGTARNFTFIVSGNYSEAEVLPFILKYLGNLPNLSNKEICLFHTREQKLVKGPVYKVFSPQNMGAFYSMESVKYSLRFITPITYPIDWKEQIKIDVLGNLIHSKVQDLRHLRGFGLYKMTALGRLNRSLSSYDIEIRLDVIPDELKAIRQTCKEIITEITNQSFEETRIKDVLQNTILPRYNAKKQSSFYRLQKLHDYYTFNESFINISGSEIENFILSLTREDMIKTAQKYLKEENLIEFVMRNQKTNELP